MLSCRGTFQQFHLFYVLHKTLNLPQTFSIFIYFYESVRVNQIRKDLFKFRTEESKWIFEKFLTSAFLHINRL